MSPGRAESAAGRAARAKRIVAGLRRLYAGATTELDHGSALELLVATILSAQCTDARVNTVTPHLFRKYRTAKDWANARLAVVEDEIRPTGFFKNKSKALVGLGQALVERFNGEVPDRMEQLVTLPGVGRKTANVVLGTWFGQPAIPVDTHVTRVSQRLQLTRNSDPVKIELDLMKLLPESAWTFTSHGLILHGRRVCLARKPDCPRCTLRPDCPFPAR